MKVLVLGGTGAMGVHVTRLLAEKGHDVVVTSRKEREARGGVRYARGNAKDPAFLESLRLRALGRCRGFHGLVDGGVPGEVP